MHIIALSGETDWSGWRSAARALVLGGVAPDAARWQVGGAGDPVPPAEGTFGLSRALVDLAALAIQARDADRFALLYRLVWRAHAGERVLELAADPDAAAARGLALAVRAEAHRMRTHLRFRPVRVSDGTWHVGWYSPAHHVLEANAQVLAQRFAEFRWSILTPERSAHWDSETLRFSGGTAPPQDDAELETTWRHEGEESLRTAREGTAIPPAEALDEAPRPVDLPPVGPVVLSMPADTALREAAREAAECRRCKLWEPATQTVFGEGPAGAAILFIGEQPGDQEDVIGRPLRGSGRPDIRPRAGGSPHRPAHDLHHQRGEAFQIPAPRHAAHP